MSRSPEPSTSECLPCLAGNLGACSRWSLAFAPVALLLTITPGAATALVVRNAAIGGRGHALLTTIGNAIGVLTWALLAAIGVAAIVATSVEAFTVVKLVGAVVLIVLGVQALRARDGADAADASSARLRLPPRAADQSRQPEARGLLRRPVPAVRPGGTAVLPCALLMAALIVALDLAWYSVLAYLVVRAKRAFVEGRGWRGSSA